MDSFLTNELASGVFELGPAPLVILILAWTLFGASLTVVFAMRGLLGYFRLASDGEIWDSRSLNILNGFYGRRPTTIEVRMLATEAGRRRIF